MLEGFQGKACWDVVVASSDYAARKAAVEEYNAANRCCCRAGLPSYELLLRCLFVVWALNLGLASCKLAGRLQGCY